MSEWQDIASAPRDGTKIDLWVNGGEWDDEIRSWIAARVPDCWWGIKVGGGFGDYKKETMPRWVHDDYDVTATWMAGEIDGEPTHWMPRPVGPHA